MEHVNRIFAESAPDPQNLSRREIRDVLTCFLAGSMTDDQVREWAESFEFRGGARYESGFEEEIDRAIFLLANPELIDGSLKNGLAVRMIRYLDRLNRG